MLSLRGIAHAFGPRRVVEAIDLDLAPGEVLCLVGPSGCGKTTLLHIAGGLSEPLEGSVANRFARPAFVFQEPRLLPWRRAGDNLAFGLRARGETRARRETAVRVLAERLGLDDNDLEKFPHELSGGMRQRVALGRALAVEPDLLLLDEPFAALDVGLKRDLQDLLRSEITRRGLAALFITHDLVEAVRLGRRVVVMGGAPGRIVHVFTPGGMPDDRDDSALHAEVGRLLAIAEVRDAFRTLTP